MKSNRNSYHLLKSFDRLVLSVVSPTEKVFYAEYHLLSGKRMNFYDVENIFAHDEADIRRAWSNFDLVSRYTKVYYCRRTY
jgi:hypothetical protein